MYAKNYQTTKATNVPCTWCKEPYNTHNTAKKKADLHDGNMMTKAETRIPVRVMNSMVASGERFK